MPNTREKLIELLEQQDDVCVKGKSCSECDNENLYKCYLYAKADHLIANGVRLEEKQATSDETSKWISVTERLPEDGAVVLGYMVSRDYRTIKWKNNTQRWEGLLLDYSKEFVTHWMPLPEPPKGE